jgi:hypothetical protein
LQTAIAKRFPFRAVVGILRRFIGLASHGPNSRCSRGSAFTLGGDKVYGLHQSPRHARRLDACWGRNAKRARCWDAKDRTPVRSLAPRRMVAAMVGNQVAHTSQQVSRDGYVTHAASLTNSVNATDVSPASSSQEYRFSDSDGAFYSCHIAPANNILISVGRGYRRDEG